MKNEIIIPDHFPDLNEESSRTVVKRRENYAVGRDLLAKENNEAIAKRLTKDREKHIPTH